MTLLKEVLSWPLGIFESKGVLGKFFVTYMTASAGAPFWLFFNKYIFNDWNFGMFVAIALTLDIIFGVLKHYKAKTLSLDEFFGKFFYNKLVPVVGVLLLVHNINNGVAIDGHDFAHDYMEYMKRSMISVYLGASIAVNIWHISGEKFPSRKFLKKVGVTDDDLKEEDEDKPKLRATK